MESLLRLSFRPGIFTWSSECTGFMTDGRTDWGILKSSEQHLGEIYDWKGETKAGTEPRRQEDETNCRCVPTLSTQHTVTIVNRSKSTSRSTDKQGSTTGDQHSNASWMWLLQPRNLKISSPGNQTQDDFPEYRSFPLRTSTKTVKSERSSWPSCILRWWKDTNRTALFDCHSSNGRDISTNIS